MSIIQVEDVSMRFNLAQEKTETLKEYTVKLLKHQLFFNEFYALRDISFKIEPGESVALIGRNGSGKSTLIKLILGLLSPSRGSISNTYRHRAYVPQRFETLNSQFPITVWEVLNCYRQVLHLKNKEIIRDCLEQMNVYSLKDQLIGNLSGGQCQKVLIARALMGHPDLLIFDEPSTGIDVRSQEELYPFIKDLNENKGVTVITVEHNLKFAVRNSTKMFHVVGGRGHFCSPKAYLDEYVSATMGGDK